MGVQVLSTYRFEAYKYQFDGFSCPSVPLSSKTPFVGALYWKRSLEQEQNEERYPTSWAIGEPRFISILLQLECDVSPGADSVIGVTERDVGCGYLGESAWLLAVDLYNGRVGVESMDVNEQYLSLVVSSH